VKTLFISKVTEISSLRHSIRKHQEHFSLKYKQDFIDYST